MATADSGKTSGQCRGCLKRGLHRKLTDACDIHGQIKLYRELFLDCFNLQMATNTNLTDLICTGCICRLNDAIDFKTQVEESEKQLLSQIALNNKYAAPNEQFLVEFSPPNTVFINEMKEMADTDDQVEVEDDIKLSEIRGLSDSSVTAKRNEKTLDLSDKANISGDLHTEELTLKVEPEEVDPVEVKEEPDDNLDYEDDTQQYEEDIQPGTLLSIELEVEEKQYHGTPSTHKTVNRHIPEERRKTSPIKESEHVEMSTNKILFGTGLQQCNQKNITNKKPSRHVKTHTTKKTYACEICHKELSSKYILKAHFRKVHGEKPFACETCGRNFSDKNDLRRHAMTHTEERPYVCDTCGLKIRRKHSLIRHIRTHTGDKRFACKVCDKKFLTNGELKSHVSVHTGEKPFTCKICDKKFRLLNTLKDHARLHTGEKPYACKMCDAKFSDSSNLRSHLKKHTGEKPISCRLCDEKFRDTAYLVKHFKKMHKEENLYACEFCTDTFPRRKYLTQHVTLAHPNKNRLPSST